MDFRDDIVEQSLLSLIVKNPKVSLDHRLFSDLFSNEFNAEIFKYVREQYADKGIVDPVKMIAGKPEKEADYIMSLFEAFSMMSSFTDYIDLLSELAGKRKIKDAIESAKHDLEADCTAEQVLSNFTKNADISSKEDIFIKSDDLTEQIFKGIDLPKERYSTGITCLDRAMLGGFFPNRMYAFCGAEKSGKTTLAHTISYNLDQAGVKHLYIAMEMGAHEIQEKNVARDLRLNPMNFINNPAVIKQRMTDATFRGNIIYSDAFGAPLQDILMRVMLAKARFGIKGFIVDYWQLIEGKPKQATKAEYLLQVAQDIAAFTKRNGLWCMLLAQLNKDGTIYASSGLDKACDQMYSIESANENLDDRLRWLKMHRTRYTPKVHIGGEDLPKLRMNTDEGVYFEEVAYGHERD